MKQTALEAHPNVPADGVRSHAHTHRFICRYVLFLNVFFAALVPLACLHTKETALWSGLWRLLTYPSELVTDYFAVGGLAATLLNVTLCGLFCQLLLHLSRVEANATTLAGYMLVIAHGFYGLNALNMWPSILGVWLYCLLRRRPFSAHIHVAFFSTALAPFVSELLFRYGLDAFDPAQVTLSPIGAVLAVLFGVAVGFVVPALLPGTTAMHRGFNMYKAGLAIGLLGIFLYAFLYKTMGIEPPEHLTPSHPAYETMAYGYRAFMSISLSVLFLLTVLWGFWLNGRSFRGYRRLLHSTGYGTDFTELYGMPLCFINIGVYGLCILTYLNLVMLLPVLLPFLPAGVGFTGASVGVLFAALTFSADGQHPRNVFPIVLGYFSLFLITLGMTALMGRPMPWSLSTQAYINGLAFATGLCPFAGKYGVKVGVIAGLLCAVICTSTTAMHGGFVLYNGGFSAGLTAMILITVLDFYGIRPKREDDAHTAEQNGG